MLVVILVLLFSMRFAASTQKQPPGIDFHYGELRLVNCEGVKSLDLSNKKIKSVNKENFISCTDLKVLHLHGNYLSSLEKDVFQYLTLDKISLHDNPWQCDCSLSWLAKWLETVTLEKDFFCSHSSDDEQIPFQHFVDDCAGSSFRNRNRRSSSAITVEYLPKEPNNCPLKYEVNTNISLQVESSDPIVAFDLLIDDVVMETFGPSETAWYTFGNVGIFQLTVNVSFAMGFETWMKLVNVTQISNRNYEIKAAPSHNTTNICIDTNVTLFVEETPRECIALDTNYTWHIDDQVILGENITYIFNDFSSNSSNVEVTVSEHNISKTFFLISNEVIFADQYHPLNTSVIIQPQYFAVCDGYAYSWMVNGSLQVNNTAGSTSVPWIQHIFHFEGSYEVVLSISTLSSYSAIIYVEKVIYFQLASSDATYVNDSYVLSPVLFSASKEYHYRWIINNENSPWEIWNSYEIPQFQHVFLNEGIYNLQLEVKNNVSYLSKNLSVTVQYPLTEVAGNFNETYVEQGQTIQLQVSFKYASIFPYHINVYDQRETLNDTFTTTDNSVLYSLPVISTSTVGKNIITFVFSDNINSTLINFIIHVLDPIVGIDVALNNNVINAGEPAEASVLNVPDGMKPISFKWFQQHSDDHPVMIGSGPNMPSYIFDKPGKYVIILEAENKISNYTHRMNLTVIHFINAQLVARLPSGLTVTAPSNVAVILNSVVEFVGEVVPTNSSNLTWFVNDVLQSRMNSLLFSYPALSQGTYKITLNASTPYGWNASSLEILVQKTISSVYLQSFVANTSLVNNTVKHINYSHVFFEPSDVIGVSGSMHCNNTNQNVNFYQTNFSQHQMNVFVVPITSISGEITCRVDLWNHVSSVSTSYWYLVGQVPMLDFVNSASILRFNETFLFTVNVTNTAILSSLKWFLNNEEIRDCSIILQPNFSMTAFCTITLVGANHIATVNVIIMNQYITSNRSLTIRLYERLFGITPVHVRVGVPTVIKTYAHIPVEKYFWNDFDVFANAMTMKLTEPQKKPVKVTAYTSTNTWTHTFHVYSYNYGHFQINSTTPIFQDGTTEIVNVEKGATSLFFISNADPYSRYNWNFIVDTGYSRVTEYYPHRQSVQYHVSSDKILITVVENNPLSQISKTLTVFSYLPIRSLNINFTDSLILTNMNTSVTIGWDGSGLQNISYIRVTDSQRFTYHVLTTEQQVGLQFLTSFESKNMSINITVCGLVNCLQRSWNFKVYAKIKNVSLAGFLPDVSVHKALSFHLFEQLHDSTSISWKLLDRNGTFVRNLGFGNSIMFSGVHEPGFYYIDVVAQGMLIEGNFLQRRFLLNVFQADCSEPLVVFNKPLYRNHLKSNWFYGHVNISTNCNDLKQKWTFIKASRQVQTCEQQSSDSVVFIPYHPSEIEVITNKSSIQLPPGAFDIGSYCIKHVISYGGTGKKFSFFYISVQSTPLIPILNGGAYRVIGSKQKVSLIGNQTIDPDGIYSSAVLLYRWKISSPCFVSQFLSIHEWSLHNVHILTKANCLKSATTYSVTMQVKREEEDVYQEIEQKIDVIDGFAPLIDIECLSCETYKSTKYLRNKKLKLLARCSNCGDLETTYEWQVIGSEDRKQIPLTAENLLSPLSTATLVLEKFVLDGVQAYTIICNVIVEGMDSPGTSSLVLEANSSPENGTCMFRSVQPVRSLIDQFEVHCSGWGDTDNKNQPFQYWLLAGMYEDASNMSVLYRGIHSSMEVYLPLGCETNNWILFVEVRVEDSLGAYTVANRSWVTVVLPDDAREGNITTFLTESIGPKIEQNAINQNLNELITLVVASLSFLNLAKNESNFTRVSNTLVKSLTKLEATSYSSTERIVDTLYKTYQQWNVTMDLSSESYHSTLVSLQKLLNVARLFAKKGIDFEDPTLTGYTSIINDNIKYEILNEKERIIDSSPDTLSYDILQLFYRVVLESLVPGENDKNLINEQISAILSKNYGKPGSSRKSIGYCGASLDITSVVQMSEVLSILECSTVDFYQQSQGMNITSFTLIDNQLNDISVTNLPMNENIVLTVPQSLYRNYHINDSVTMLSNELHMASLHNFSQVPDLEHTGIHIVFDLTDAEDSSDGNIYIYFSENVPLSYDSTEAQKKVVNKYSDEESRTVFLSGRNYKTDSLYYYGLQNNFHSPVNITVTIYTSRCTFWNVSTSQWESSGCKPTSSTTRQKVSCKCNHLTSFTGSLELSPNRLDFSVLKKLDFHDNPVAVITCSVIVVLYLVALFFAYRKDRKEQNEEHVVHYIGSDEGFYQYEIRIKTGMYPWAGTTARVGIQIFGTSCTTKVRVIETINSFQRNAIDIFRISLDRSIGKIYKVQVWHDNSGTEPSWYLERIVIRSLVNGEKFFFFCNRWIGVDCSDGTLEHEFHVADVHEMKKFSTIFFDVLARGLSDYHLWLSLFERPKFSRFTRIQRITCLLTTILSWMCVSAMWFQVAPEGKVDLYIGFRGYSIEELLIGMISVAMVFPLNLLLVFLFRKSKQGKTPQKKVRVWQPSRYLRQDLVSVDMVHLLPTDDEQSDDATSLSFIRRKKKHHNIHSLLQDKILCDDNNDAEEATTHLSSGVSNDPSIIKQKKRLLNRTSTESSLFTNISLHLSNTQSNHAEVKKEIPDDIYIQDQDQISEADSFHSEFSLHNDESLLLNSHKVEFSDSFLDDIKERPPLLRSNFSGAFDSSMKHGIGVLSDYSSGIVLHNDVIKPSKIMKNEMLAEHLNIPDIIELDPVTRWFLPHWCIYVAYTLCFLISGLSIVIVITYGQQFGTDVSLKWLKTLFLGFFEDLFCAYPFLLLTVAFVLAMFVKPLDLDKVDHDDFVECADGKSVQYDSNMETLFPPSGYALELLQRDGLKMKHLRKFVKDVLFQALLMWFILGICYSKYSTRWYETTKMFEKDLNYPMNIANVSKITDYWSWLNSTFLPFAFNNHKNTNEWKMSSDPVIRQIRSTFSDCVAEKHADMMNIKFCSSSSFMKVTAFNNNWSLPLEEKFDEKVVASPWVYRRHKLLKTIGAIRTYPASGYEWRLHLSDGLQASQLALKNLLNHQWIDRSTRALVHNVIGLHTTSLQYASITLLVEISRTGSMHTMFDLKYFPVKYFLTNLDYFSMFCMIMLSLLTVYMFVYLIRQIHTKNWGCLTTFWNVHLVVTMLTSMAALMLQVGHLFALYDFRDDLVNGYIPYGISSRSISFLDDVIMYVFGFLAFLVIARVIRLFRCLNSYKSTAELLRSSLKTILQLMGLHIIVTLCFSALLLLTFQPYVYEYRNFWHSFWTVLFYRWSNQKVKETINSSRGLGMFWNILSLFYWLILAVIFKVVLMNNFPSKVYSTQVCFFKCAYEHLLKSKKKERHVRFLDDDNDEYENDCMNSEKNGVQTHLPPAGDIAQSNIVMDQSTVETKSFANYDDLPPLPTEFRETDPNLSVILKGLDEMVAYEYWLEESLLKIQQKLS